MGDESYFKGAFEGLNRNETVVMADKWASDSLHLVGLILATLVIMTFIILLTIYCLYPETCPNLNPFACSEVEKPQNGSFHRQTGFDSPPDYNTLVTTTQSSAQP